MSLGRRLTIWLGSFLAVATVLIAWCRVPMGPLLLGGAVTLAGTILRSISTKRRSRS